MGWFLSKSASAKSAPSWLHLESASSGLSRATSKASNDWVFQPITLQEAAAQPTPTSSSKPGRSASHRHPVRRSSAPQLNLQQAQAASDLMANPPVFNNPLRRRGCCDHAYSEELAAYRQDAIRRELAASQQSRPGRSLSLDQLAA